MLDSNLTPEGSEAHSLGCRSAPRSPRGGTRTFAPRWPAIAVLAIVLLALLAGCAASGAGAGAPDTLGGDPLGARSSSGSSAAVTPPPSVADLQQTVITVIKSVQPSVVEIKSTAAQGAAIGSGEIVTADGYIVTNDHVVRGFTGYTVTLASGASSNAKLVGQAPDDDLAVLKIEARNVAPIAFAQSANVQVGQFAIAIGSPLGLDQTATFGIVSALNRTASEAPDGPATLPLTGLVQTSAPINPGNSGGALVDLQGRLIGIPTLGAMSPFGGAANGIGFAIPANRVQVVVQQLIKNGHLTSSGLPYLGIQGQSVTPELAAARGLAVTSGVLVTAFSNDASGRSPARDAGVHVGDVITGINGHTVSDNDTLLAVFAGLTPGSGVTLALMRGQQRLSLRVRLGERPIGPQG